MSDKDLAKNLADQWYPGNFVVEKKLFKDTPPFEPNGLAGDVYKELRETNAIKADKFYKRIYQPFD